MIPFNIPCYVKNEKRYLSKALRSRKFSGDGPFTKKCSEWLEKTLGSRKALLVTSGTHALEMAAILADIKSGDEVIMPSYTFVSTANAFVLRGAKIVFVDIRPDTMNIDETLIDQAITKKTKAIVVVHYGGVACEMDEVMRIANEYKLLVIEDAAQAIMAKYKGKYLGTIGDIGCISFHETKNISCGEGGALLINKSELVERAEIIREKGTNRSKFFRGLVDKYTWVDIGSSYLPSELNAAFLYAQLLWAEKITRIRVKLWGEYSKRLLPLEKAGYVSLPKIPEDCIPNGHMFFLKAKNLEERTRLIDFLKKNGVMAVFHYIPLHSSPFGRKAGRLDGKDRFTTKESERLLRLPMFYKLKPRHAVKVCKLIDLFYQNRTVDSRVEIVEPAAIDGLADSVMVFAISVLLSINYLVVRLGFNDLAVVELVKALGIASILIFLPFSLNVLNLRLKSKLSLILPRSNFIVMLGSLLVLVMLGFLPIDLSWLFAGFGILLAIFSLLCYRRWSKSFKSRIVHWILGFILGFWIAGTIWGSGYLSPLFLERIALGFGHIDTLFHGSIAAMLRTYSAPSTGLDGLPYLSYHWGSHYMFAQLSKLLHIGSYQFYNLAYPIIFPAFMIRSFIYMISAVKSKLKLPPRNEQLVHLLSHLLLILIFTGGSFDSLTKVGGFIGTIFVTESYCIGLALAFIFINLVFNEGERLLKASWQIKNVLLSMVILPLFLGIIGLVKVSISQLLFCALLYLFIRLRLYRKMHFWLSLFAYLVTMAIVSRYSYGGGEKLVIWPFYYFETYVEPSYRLIFPLLYFSWVWFYSAIRITQLKIKSFSQFGLCLRSEKLIDLEILLLISLVGIIPSCVLYIPGGSSFFYSDLQRWLAISFVIASIPIWFPKKISVKKNFSGLLFFPAIVLILLVIGAGYSFVNIKKQYMVFVSQQLKLRYTMLPKGNELSVGYIKYITKGIRSDHLSFRSAFKQAASIQQEELEHNSNYRLVAYFSLLQKLPDKQKTAIYIPQDSFMFSHLGSYAQRQFIAPALSGMALIGGVQPYAPLYLDEKEMDGLIKQLNDEQSGQLLNYYREESDPGSTQKEYMLKNTVLSNEEKIQLYNITAPLYYNTLAYYGFWSYDYTSEESYMDRFSSEEHLCKYALSKQFSKVVVVSSSQKDDVQSKIVNCSK